MDPMQRAPGGNRGPKRSTAVAAGTGQDSAPSLFDAVTDAAAGRRLRDDGMRTAEHAAHPWVKVAVDEAIKRWAARRVPFVSDDIRDEVPMLASSPKLLGARINAAARQGLIRKTGTYRQSRNASRHGGVVAEWIGGAS
jgi:hypothetical protein